MNNFNVRKDKMVFDPSLNIISIVRWVKKTSLRGLTHILYHKVASRNHKPYQTEIRTVRVRYKMYLVSWLRLSTYLSERRPTKKTYQLLIGFEHDTYRSSIKR